MVYDPMFRGDEDQNVHFKVPKRKTTIHGYHVKHNFSVEVSYGTMQNMYEDIGKFHPEKGGFLFGGFNIPENKVVINNFICDSAGRASHISYYPSERSNNVIKEYELETMQSFIGVVHSHPVGMDYPSGPDLVAMDSLLERNSHLNFVVAPIINSVEITDSRYEKLLSLDGSNIKISFYIRNRHSELFCPGRIYVFEYNEISPSVPVRDVQYVLNTLGLESLLNSSTLVTTFRERRVIMITANIMDKKVVFIFSPSYPVSCPTVIIYRDNKALEVTTYEWSASGRSNEMLLSIINKNT